MEHVDRIGREAEAQLQEDWSTKESTVMAGAMNSQQIVVGTKAHEQVHADLSLKKEALLTNSYPLHLDFTDTVYRLHIIICPPVN